MPDRIFHFKDRKELRMWLQSNCKTEKECWVVCSRASEAAQGTLSYIDVVEEALCFGWIDSTCRKEGDIPLQRLSPRRKGSRWTELNKERCRRLERLGLMTEEGRKVLPDMDISQFLIEDEVMAALKEDDDVWRNFQAFPPLYRRVRIGNIQIKKGTELFESRLRKFVEYTRRNVIYGEWNDKGRLLSD